MALEKASWKRRRLSLSWQDEQHVGHSRWQKGLSQGVEKRQRGGRSGRSRWREESGRLRGPGAEPGLGSAQEAQRSHRGSLPRAATWRRPERVFGTEMPPSVRPPPPTGFNWARHMRHSLPRAG